MRLQAVCCQCCVEPRFGCAVYLREADDELLAKQGLLDVCPYTAGAMNSPVTLGDLVRNDKLLWVYCCDCGYTSSMAFLRPAFSEGAGTCETCGLLVYFETQSSKIFRTAKRRTIA